MPVALLLFVHNTLSSWLGRMPEPQWSNIAVKRYRMFLIGHDAVTCVAEKHVTSDYCQLTNVGYPEFDCSAALPVLTNGSI